MYIKRLAVLLFFLPLNSLAQTVNADAAFAQMQAQQQYMLQQQQLQAQQLAEQQAAQAEAAASAQKKQGIFQLIFGFCSNMFRGSPNTAMGSQGKRLSDDAYSIGDAAYRARESQGFQYEQGIDRELARRVGSSAATGNFSAGCNQFINKEGELGPWGSYALQQIKDKPQSFGENFPGDITNWCKDYGKMSKDQRELYWVWVLMAMSSSESSCNPTNDNRNAPNGTAVGLFQVWQPVCPKARDLHRPNENIQCAVDLLAKELQNRDTLMTPTSRGRQGTYWGPLRNDDWNKARGGDISGAEKTRAIMGKYPFCNGVANPVKVEGVVETAPAANDPNFNVPAANDSNFNSTETGASGNSNNQNSSATTTTTETSEDEDGDVTVTKKTVTKITEVTETKTTKGAKARTPAAGSSADSKKKSSNKKK
ncbi:hypothetical protein [Bdellovibrio reynosensis]|uniref:Transglycosylase SLT domain-containing protein n=1 Tax=Bdellovibrio reynosensis TaxID=2835041 RepID=A0ABY4CB24_9BACT|nr:hypothetical protein [Bdellovibrio reynosensis]UOF00718.1 hypothetical protein MNR06_13530 [Bdellovibrio reynosensis]